MKIKYILYFLVFIYQTSLAYDTFLTIYNQNMAVIREIREVLITDSKELIFSDVPEKIDPTSVKLSIPGVEVLEQNYEYDLVNHEKLLQNRLGQTVDLILEQGEIVSGKLLTPAGWGIVLETGTGIRIIKEGVKQIILQGNTEGMFLKPTLIWRLDKKPKEKVLVELTYITNDINWKAEYILSLNSKGKQFDFQGWVDVQNNSGADYHDANIKLIAGSIHRVYPSPYPAFTDRAELLVGKAPSSQFEQRELYEYHLYELQRKTTLSDRQNKQISLMSVIQVPYTQEYHYSAFQGNKKVQSKIIFKNDKEHKLNLPLPAGRVRIFQEEPNGNREFIGEDVIEHTPTSSEVTLTVGDAFDLVGETVQLEYRNVTNKISETDYKVNLRNSKKEDVVLIVIINGYGDWNIVKSSEEVTDISAQEKRIIVKIASNSKKTITYTIRQQSL
ncbi:MAG: hypothetical protein N2450_04525 [bacterium]|nr:hypothetical protein [bacterium]